MTLVSVIGSVAGAAIFAAAVAVLEAMDPLRTHRWGSAAVAVLICFAGASMSVAPQQYGWQAVTLACGLALVTWRNIRLLREQVACRSRWPRFAPIVAVGVLAGCMAVMPALGFDIKGNTITLNDSEMAACRAEGGCALVTGRYHRSLITEARRCGSI